MATICGQNQFGHCDYSKLGKFQNYDQIREIQVETSKKCTKNVNIEEKVEALEINITPIAAGTQQLKTIVHSLESEENFEEETQQADQDPNWNYWIDEDNSESESEFDVSF